AGSDRPAAGVDEDADRAIGIELAIDRHQEDRLRERLCLDVVDLAEEVDPLAIELLLARLVDREQILEAHPHGTPPTLRRGRPARAPRRPRSARTGLCYTAAQVCRSPRLCRPGGVT